MTTPVHMRAIVASGQRFPRTALVVSATAPLDVELAGAIERQFESTVLEMFGSTETCVIAARRTSTEREWQLYPDVVLTPEAEGASVNAPWFVEPMRLQDFIELHAATGSSFRGGMRTWSKWRGSVRHWRISPVGCSRFRGCRTRWSFSPMAHRAGRFGAWLLWSWRPR